MIAEKLKNSFIIYSIKVLSKRRLFDKKIKMAAQCTTNKVATLIKEYTNHEYVYATLLGVAGIFTILTFSFPLITQV